MQIEDYTSVPNDDALRPDVTHAGPPAAVPSYDIAPEDRHHLEAVRASSLDIAPPPYSGLEGIKLSPLTVAALPKERGTGVMAGLLTQSEVSAQLVGVPEPQRAEAEHRLVADAIRAIRPALRTATGVGAAATPFQREMVAIAGEVQGHYREIARLQEVLDEVERHDTVIDEATGEAKAVPVYRVHGDRLRAIQHQQAVLLGHVRALVKADNTPGHEGAKRLQAAEYESVMERKALVEALEDEATAKREAAKQVREDRIAKRVATMKGSGLKQG
ncbi:MAG: hypothetical protein ACTHLU_09095 [Novosphingobium sp.]